MTVRAVVVTAPRMKSSDEVWSRVNNHDINILRDALSLLRNQSSMQEAYWAIRNEIDEIDVV